MKRESTSRPYLSIAVLLGAGVLGNVSCSSEDSDKSDLGDRCSLNSECREPLTCGFERCRPECATSRDCGGRRCMRTAKGANVCQLEDEVNCTHNSQCPGEQICAADLQCRDQCVSSKDCVSGQECVESVCVEPTELDDQGLLPSRTPSEGVRCTYATECPGDLVCLNGVCAIECYEDKDCFVTWGCFTVEEGGDGRCYPPGQEPRSDGGPRPDGGAGGDAGDGGASGPILQLALEAGCAVMLDRRVKCWDFSESGGYYENALPEFVPGLENVVQLVGSQEHRYARLADGTVRYFGANVRDPRMQYVTNPAALEDLTGIVRIGGFFSDQIVAEASNGDYWYAEPNLSARSDWHSGIDRAIGVEHVLLVGGGVAELRMDLLEEKGLTTVVDATAIAIIEDSGDLRESACAIRSNGNLLCWGTDPRDAGAPGVYLGGDDPVMHQPAPTLVTRIPNARQIVANRHRTAVLDATGQVWTWCPQAGEACGHGAPQVETIGDGGEFRAVKLARVGPLGFDDLEPVCAITAEGDLYCALWGNQFEYLEGLENVVDAMVTMGRVYAVLGDGSLKAWTHDWFGPGLIEDIPL